MLLLAGCQELEDASNQAAWAEDQASANAERIEALERRLADLERKAGGHEELFDAATNDLQTHRDLINGNAEVFNDFKDITNNRLHWLEAHHGR